MKDDKEKIKEETRGRKMQSDSVRVVPILKKSIDISKFGKVILALIASQEEEEEEKKDNNSGGVHHDEVV